MIEINLIPHEGIIIQNIGKICFGQTPDDVRKTLGNPSLEYSSYYHNNILCFYNPAYTKYLPADIVHVNNTQYFYHDFEIRVDFNAKRKIEFIEFITGPFPDKVKPIIYEKDAFSLLADELINLLSEKNSGAIDIQNPKELKKGYWFLETDVSIWRDMNEAEAEECIKEGKADGVYEMNKDSFEKDLSKSRHFWTVGIGYEGYFRKSLEEQNNLKVCGNLDLFQKRKTD